MDRLAPEGAYGSYFFGFVVIEDGWASGVVYNTASREREEQEGARGQTISKCSDPRVRVLRRR